MLRKYIIFCFCLAPLVCLAAIFDLSMSGLEFNREAYHSPGWRLHSSLRHVVDEDHVHMIPTTTMQFYYAENQDKADSAYYFGYNIPLQQDLLFARSMFGYDSSHQYLTAIVDNWLDERAETYLTGLEYDEQQRLTMLYEVYAPYEWPGYAQKRQHYVYTSDTDFYIVFWTPYLQDNYYARYDFTRDSAGRITQGVLSESSDSVNWVPAKQFQQSYSASDNSTGASLVCDWAHHFPTGFIDYAEPDFGKLATANYQYNYGAGWENGYRKTWTYLFDGKLSQVLTEMWQDSLGWVETFRDDYEYDANRNLINHYALYLDSDGWLAREWYSYTWEQFTPNADEHQANLPKPTLLTAPNPFSSKVSLNFQSSGKGQVRWDIYNLTGQRIRHLEQTGKSVIWDGLGDNHKPVGNGIYFIRAEQEGKSQTCKVIRLK